MNLEQSEDERKFETQQIEAARLDDDGPSPNPFAAALGLAGIVAIIALMILIWPILETVVGAFGFGIDRASVLLNEACSGRWPGRAAFEPFGRPLIVLMGATICILAGRSLLRDRSTIAPLIRGRHK
jgi:hypothetical protein